MIPYQRPTLANQVLEGAELIGHTGVVDQDMKLAALPEEGSGRFTD
jgi:hypothetical protein